MTNRSKQTDEFDNQLYDILGYCFDRGAVCHRDFVGEPVGQKPMSFEEKQITFQSRWEALKNENTQIPIWEKGKKSTETRAVSQIVSDLIKCGKSCSRLSAYLGYGYFYWSREFRRGLEYEGCEFDEDVTNIFKRLPY